MATFSQTISDSANDVFSIPAFASFDAGSLGSGNLGFGVAYGGVRFTSVTVPQGATINSATLRLVVNNTGSNSGSSGFGTWYGDDVDDAAAWSSGSAPQSITKTTASATALGSTTDGQIFNHDIASIVQEIVDRAGWASGNDMRFATDPTGSTGFVEWADYSVEPSNAAQLSIDYTAGGTAYSLTANSGSFTLTGQTAALKAARNVSAASGSFALTGQAATLKRGYPLSAAAGSFTLTGQTATLKATRTLTASSGAFTLTGQDAGLARGLKVAAGAGSYSLTGQAATLVATRALAAASGSYTLTGQAAALVATRALSADSGAFVLTGQDATLIYGGSVGYTLEADAGAYVLTGIDAALSATRQIAADSGSFTLDGQAATLAAGWKVAVDSGSFTMNGRPAYFRYVPIWTFAADATAGAFVVTPDAAPSAYPVQQDSSGSWPLVRDEPPAAF